MIPHTIDPSKLSAFLSKIQDEATAVEALI